MGTNLDSLPREVIGQIVVFLKADEAAKLRQLSKAIKSGVDASPLWKKRMS